MSTTLVTGNTSRWRRTARRLGLVLGTLALATAPALLPALPVTATASLVALTTSSGIVGSSVGVQGTIAAGATPLYGYEIRWDGTAIKPKSSASSGAVSTTVTVPDSPRGTHTITLYDYFDNTTSDSTFTVVPSVILKSDTTTGTVGSQVVVYGFGWGASETGISVTYDALAVQTATASTTGTWQATFNAPDSASGATHTVSAFSSVTAASSVTGANFTILPNIAVNPTLGTVGASVTVTGTGFRAAEPGLTLTFDGNTVASNVNVSATGGFSGTFVVPDSPSGSRLVGAYGSYTTGIASLNFTVNPKVTIAPTAGTTGTPVTATGTGFAANESNITITFDTTPVKQGISAGANGRWTASFAVPPGAGGSHTITVAGATTSATTVGSVPFAVAARLNGEPLTGKVGTKVTLSGASFGANETGINILYDNQNVATGLSADANGNWSGTFTVPASPTGNHQVTASGVATPAASVTAIVFAVSPVLTIDPTTGFVGGQVAVNGSGLAGNRQVTVTYDGKAVVTTPAALSTDARGSITAAFTAPVSKSGAHKVLISDTVNNITLDFAMDSAAPPAPALNNPPSGARLGFFGGEAASLKWGAVTDPSGVSYILQVATSSDFTTPYIERANLAVTTFETQALDYGTYYWRVRAIDQASNESAWSAVSVFNEGYVPMIPFIIGVAVLVIGIGLGVFFGMRRRSVKWPEEKQERRRKGKEEPELEAAPEAEEAEEAEEAPEAAEEDEPEAEPEPPKPSGKGQPEKAPVGKDVKGKRPPEPAPVPARGERPVARKGQAAEPPPEKEEAPPPPPAPAESPEADSAVIRAVTGLTDADVSLVAQREDMRQLGLNLARIYKVVARLEKSGALIRDGKGKFQPGGKAGRAVASEEEEMFPTEAPAEEPKKAARTPPPPPPATKQEFKAKVEKPPARIEEPPRVEKPAAKPEAPPPPAKAMRRKGEPEAEAEPGAPPPAPEPARAAAPVFDAATEEAVIDAVEGLDDSDIPQLAQADHIRSLGLNLARIYKLCSKLEKDGKLIRDAKGKYRRPEGGAVPEPPPEHGPETFDFEEAPRNLAPPPEPPRGRKASPPEEPAPLPPPVKKAAPPPEPPRAKRAPPPLDEIEIPKPKPPAAPTGPDETDEAVMEAVVGQSDADIPQVAQLPEMKSRGLNLAKLYQIAGRLEKTGVLMRDDRGRYQRSTPSKPGSGLPVEPLEAVDETTASGTSDEPAAEAPEPVSEASAGAAAEVPAELPPGQRPTGLEWSGKLPWQEWWTFYSKVLSRFLGEDRFTINAGMKVAPRGGVSQEKVDETIASLRELALPDKLGLGQAEERKGVQKHYASLEWKGVLPWHSWEGFYAKCVSRFLADESLVITINFKVQPKDGLSDEDLEETRDALDGLGMKESLRLS